MFFELFFKISHRFFSISFFTKVFFFWKIFFSNGVFAFQRVVSNSKCFFLKGVFFLLFFSF